MNGMLIQSATCAPMHAVAARAFTLPIRDRAWHDVEKLCAPAALAGSPAYVHAARAQQRFPVYHRITLHASGA